MNQPPKAVFLSYASQDAAAAREICESLRQAGVEVWFDQSELRGGDAWDQKIRRQIRECTLFVPVISANTQARLEGYFRLEWKLAARRTHAMADAKPFLLPVTIDDTRDTDAHVPEEFRAVQWTRIALRPAQGLAAFGDSLGAFCERAVLLLKGAASVVGHSRSAPPIANSKPWTHAERSDTLDESTPRKRHVFSLNDPKPMDFAPAKSIAVLAFANLSHDPENEYFCDGMSDELLTVLQKIDGLRVAARTSAFFFKGRNVTAQEIGEALGVAHLVEGSVRKSGNVVRISARLSRAATSEQLWSESYTRELKDIFAVQDEIAQTIVRELRPRLPGAAGEDRACVSAASEVKAASRGRTENAEAYQLYLQGRFFAARLTPEDSERGIAYFRQALALDSGFALAWAELARTYSWEAGWIGALPFAEGFRLSREAAERALTLEPKLVEGLSALFRVQAWHDWDWAEAKRTIRRALELAPGDAGVLADAASLAISLGDTAQAIELARNSVDHDPVNAEARIKLGLACLWAGQLDMAEEAGRRASELNPRMTWGFGLLGMVRVVQGRFDEAIECANQEQAEWLRLTLIAIAGFAAGHTADADRALGRLLDGHADLAPYQLAQVYAGRGQIEDAFVWLDRAYVQRDSGIAYAKLDPLLRNLRGSELWLEILRKVGLAGELPA